VVSICRHRLEPARHHRIGRPHECRDEGRREAWNLFPGEIAGVAGKQQHGAGKAKQCADDVMDRQPFARQ
jgi:hypothetical protein